MIDENLRFEKIRESLPEEVKCKIKELEDKLPGPCLKAPDPEPNKLKTRLLMFIYEMTPEIMKNAGRPELEKVYATFIDIMSSNLEYVPAVEFTETKDIIQDFHHHYPGIFGYETVHYTIPEHYEVSKTGESEIRDYQRELIESYPFVEGLALESDWFVGHPWELGPEEDSLIYKLIYRRSSIPEARRNAGEHLGYSKLRILANVHPIAAAVSGIAVAGAASGLAYTLFQYLNK